MLVARKLVRIWHNAVLALDQRKYELNIFASESAHASQVIISFLVQWSVLWSPLPLWRLWSPQFSFFALRIHECTPSCLLSCQFLTFLSVSQTVQVEDDFDYRPSRPASTQDSGTDIRLGFDGLRPSLWGSPPFRISQNWAISSRFWPRWNRRRLRSFLG